MAPRKRKSIPIDSDSDDNYGTPVKSARRKSATTASSSKKGVSNSGSPEISNYVARLVTPEYGEIQTRWCLSYTPNYFPGINLNKCMSCTEKQAISGGCRFVYLRAFKDVNGKIDYSDYAFRSNLEPLPRVRGPKKAQEKKVLKKAVPRKAASKEEPKEPIRRGTRSRPAPVSKPVIIDIDTEEDEAAQDEIEAIATEAHGANLTSAKLNAEADYVLTLIAPTFVEQLRREKHHEFTHLGLPTKGTALSGGPRPLIRIPSTLESRSLCDACATSIYMGSYLCGGCGSELCLGCWEEWEPSDARESGRLRSRDCCSKKRRHLHKSMVFVSRTAEGEISELLERVERRIPSAEKQEQEDGDATLDIESIPTSQPSWPNEKGPKYLPTPKTHYSELTLRQFQALWRKGGVPLVLTGFLDRFKLPWDPAYFIAKHGKESCFIHNCVDGTAMESTVAKFFSKFSDPACIESHKLKDWPPSADFSTTFPKLFGDFESALPFPSYTARKGTLNLAAHFPEGYNAPDLGPKMYNAYPAPDFLPDPSSPRGSKDKKAASETRDVKGTTNLHLDLTDAMNIMLFSAGGTLAPESSTTSKGIPACGAIWDIFPPSASNDIRTYLNSPAYINSHPGAMLQDDPIHRQCYYLSEADLTILYKKYGVRSHRIFQEPGDAIFVPAGCCHQVRNRRSCVKVAVDFLTPENVKVCKGLIEEARRMAGDFGKGRRGKEDVLQLWACLGFAWGVYDHEKKEKRLEEKEAEKIEDGIKDEEVMNETVGDAVMTDVGGDESGDEKVDTKDEGVERGDGEVAVAIVDAEDSKGDRPTDEEQKPLDCAENKEATTVQAAIKNHDKAGSEREAQFGGTVYPEVAENEKHTKFEAKVIGNHLVEKSTRTEIEVMKAEPNQGVVVESGELLDGNTTEMTGAGVKLDSESVVEA